MNAKFKISLILLFLLFGLVTVVYAAGTISSSWMRSSSDTQKNPSVNLYDQGMDVNKEVY